MGRIYCEHGTPEEIECWKCAFEAYKKTEREQRRYEIARDVMAALCASNPGANVEIAANDAVYSADALLAALETDR